MRKFLLIAIFLFSISRLQAQLQKSAILVSKTNKPIAVDGILNEPGWQTANTATNFWQNFPFDSSLALSRTIVRAAFDDKFLYFGITAYQQNKYIVRSLKRDYENGSTDLVFMNINPFRDKLNTFYFTVSPYGTQKEGLVSNGSELSVDWDNKWYCETKRYEDRWEAEVAIPFKTLRYRISSGSNIWEINFGRNDLVRNERSSWAPVPRNFRLIDANFTNELVWETPPPKPGSNISFIPFALTAINKDFENNRQVENNISGGFDAKVAVTPSLNLDLTLNPDFAQVEVDQQITNLSRFELFFPERRQFFLENSDLFGSFGSEKTNPFFSRRIGLVSNSTTGNNEKIPILGGARLSGRINKNWRVGFLNMQTRTYEKDSIPAINYTVAAIQRRIFGRSNLAFVLINKQGVNHEKARADLNTWNRLLGVDMNIASNNGQWLGKWYNHISFTPGVSKDVMSNGLLLNYSKPTFSFETDLYHIGKGFNAETGFVPRTGIIRNASSVDFIFFPKGKPAQYINNWRIIPDYDIYYSKFDRRVTDWDAGIFFSILLQNSAEIAGTLLRWDYTYLFEDFDPTNKNDSLFRKLPAGSSYIYSSNRLSFSSNRRNNFFFNIFARAGEYFNGSILSLKTDWNYRWQPYGVFSMNVNYSRVRLPSGYNNADFWLVGPRFEITFSRSVFWTTFIQYNNQANNVNINSRFQWRFGPVSDLFVVYTDNYFAGDYLDPVQNRFYNQLSPRNRALVVKLNYWFNL